MVAAAAIAPMLARPGSPMSSPMSMDATHAEAAERLSAAIDEMRAEVTATRAVLKAVLADDRAAAGPLAELAESASRLVGFAGGDSGREPAAEPPEPANGDASAPSHPMRRITDWAEGVLHALPPGSHIVTRRRSEQY